MENPQNSGWADRLSRSRAVEITGVFVAAALATSGSLAVRDLVSGAEPVQEVATTTTTVNEVVVAAEDPRYAAETMLARSDSVQSMTDLWTEHAQNVPLSERLSVQGFAGERFGLTFNAQTYALDETDAYFEHLNAAHDIPGAIDAANEFASELGLTFVIPEQGMVVDELAIEPLEDITPSELVSWLGSQINSFRFIPKELIEFSGVDTIYLVDSIEDANGLADFQTQSIFIDRSMILNGTGGLLASEQNVVPHELAHHIHKQLFEGGYMDNNVMLKLAMSDDLATSTYPNCDTLSRFDRPGTAEAPYEHGASLIARILRNEELAPVGRDGLAMSSAYVLDAMQRALPDTDISGYYLSMMRGSNMAQQGAQELSLEYEWDTCVAAGLIG